MKLEKGRDTSLGRDCRIYCYIQKQGCMVVMSIPIPGRSGWLTFISRKGNYLNLYNNFTLFTVLCLITYHNWLSLTSVFFCLQLGMIFKVVTWAILESYSVFAGCLTCIQEVYMLFNFSCFFSCQCLFITGKSQPRIKKSRGKLFFLPYKGNQIASANKECLN